MDLSYYNTYSVEEMPRDVVSDLLHNSGRPAHSLAEHPEDVHLPPFRRNMSGTESVDETVRGRTTGASNHAPGLRIRGTRSVPLLRSEA